MQVEGRGEAAERIGITIAFRSRMDGSVRDADRGRELIGV